MSKNVKISGINFKPEKVVKNLISVLSDRAKDIIVQRYGLKNKRRLTLEAIGKQYKITRERVRQIENYAFDTILKSDEYKKERLAFANLEKMIDSMGGIVHEDDLLEYVSSDTLVQNEVHFLLVLGESFKKAKEDKDFKHRWYLDDDLYTSVHDSLKNLYKSMSNEDLVSEGQIVTNFLEHLRGVNQKYRNDEIIRRWLALSKKIGKNPLNEWGRSDSPNITLKGMRDYAYLVLKQHGSPLHFSEVADKIKELFDKRAHVATCHNELIKDERFVLVGRGLYALKDWGYVGGIVREVIEKVLKENGPMTKEEIVDKVLKERYVKENTIAVNLQNTDLFKRDKQNRYSVI
jgi:DNA-directed RNA polymerase delta subunit